MEVDRVPAGRLNGISGEIGTVLGPKEITREFVVVTGVDDNGLTVGYATPDDLDITPFHDPRGVTEARMVILRQMPWIDGWKRLFL